MLPDGPPDMFICGDDAEAKSVVAGLCAELAFPAFDVGALARSAQLEQLAWLWISIALQGTTGGHAFRLLRRPLP
jgi:predicted dinucleotide-binding enzyme